MKKILFRLKFYTVTLIRLVYSFLKGGESCVVCGNSCLLIPVCKSCRKEAFRVTTSNNRCENCGKVLISTKETCLECRENPVLVSTDYTMPLFSYRLWNKELLYLWKMKSVRALSGFFALKVAVGLKELGVEFIVPVPPRKGKITKNGWDQIDELCSILENVYGFGVLKLLERTSKKQQKKLDRNERLQTIESAYVMKSDREIEKTLKRGGGCLPGEVCIIDDVCTTGSTLECCAKLLKQYGIKRVGALTLFIVD